MFVLRKLNEQIFHLVPCDFCQASRPYFISTRPISIHSFDKFEQNSCFLQCKYGKKVAGTRQLLFIMSHSSYVVSCIKAGLRGGTVIIHIFTGGETEARLGCKAGTELRCWESKAVLRLLCHTASFTVLALTGPDNLLNAAEFIRVMDPDGPDALFMRWDITANTCACASRSRGKSCVHMDTQTGGERSIL